MRSLLEDGVSTLELERRESEKGSHRLIIIVLIITAYAPKFSLTPTVTVLAYIILLCTAMIIDPSAELTTAALAAPT
jgi:hypothetical protein